MELGKCNESYVVPQETKVIEGPMVAKCPGLGLEDQQLRSFTPLVEGSFMHSSCDATCCKHCSFDPKEKNESMLMCLHCKRNRACGNDEVSS